MDDRSTIIPIFPAEDVHVKQYGDRGYNVEEDETGTRPHVIRTTDRAIFKRCRRKWFWQSHIKARRVPKAPQQALWFGIGFHYALDDFHGANYYGHPATALVAYVDACHRLALQPGIENPEHIYPPDAEEYKALGVAMLNHYADVWLPGKDLLETFVYNGQMQTEVDFEIPLPTKAPDGRPVVYRGRLDRVVVDPDGRLWILEYKTAKAFRIYHFDTDDQISSYCWAASVLYPEYEVAGVVYQQFKKTVPSPPRELANGTLSCNKQQSTTAALYRKALLNKYGDILLAPNKNVEFLNWLLMQEDSESDRFIRRDKVYRNAHQIAAQGEKILIEVLDMVNPELSLYPNPTKDCEWDCPMQMACIAMDDGGDADAMIDELTTVMKGELGEPWKKFLLPPQEVVVPQVDLELLNNDLELELGPQQPQQEDQ